MIELNFEKLSKYDQKSEPVSIGKRNDGLFGL